MDESLDIERLLGRAAAGDADAWRRIVDAYGRRVFGLLRAQCGNSDLAEEITQSTFCTMAEKLAGYTESGRFEQWLFRIAMNRLRDEMRRRKRHAVSVADDTLTGLAGAAPAAPAAFAPEDVEALSRAIARLNEADREVVHLRHFAGLSFKQIAEMLDQPLGTVLARQHRALRKIRELMEREIEPEADDSEPDPSQSIPRGRR